MRVKTSRISSRLESAFASNRNPIPPFARLYALLRIGFAASAAQEASGLFRHLLWL
jgi:hypothetical protein